MIFFGVVQAKYIQVREFPVRALKSFTTLKPSPGKSKIAHQPLQQNAFFILLFNHQLKR